MEAVRKEARAAHDFGVKAVNNASSLLEHSQSSLATLRNWQSELAESMSSDQQTLETSLESSRAALSDAISRVEQMSKTRAKKHEEAASGLERTIEQLGDIAVPAWISTAKTLKDFVMLEGAQELSSEVETMQREANRLAESLVHLEKKLASNHHAIETSLRKICPLEAQQTLGSEIPNRDMNDHPAFQPMREFINDWMHKVKLAIDEQRELVSEGSFGSVALAKLQDQLLRDSSSSLDHLAKMDFVDQLYQFVNVSAKIEQNQLEKQQQQQQKQQQQQNQKQRQLVKPKVLDTGDLELVELIKRAHKGFKVLLKSMVFSVEEVKSLSAGIKKAYDEFSQVSNMIQDLEREALEAIEQASIAQTLSQELGSSIDDIIAETSKLEGIYVNYMSAQESIAPEVLRRWKALAEIEELARKYQDEINSLVTKEVQAREAFSECHGQYLPESFCPPLAPGAQPTSFQFLIVNGEDAEGLGGLVESINTNTFQGAQDNEALPCNLAQGEGASTR
mmetsp:Transcript_12212/g.22649  ORF Transcript_12212/g.22649 Transcript_12212/m.22649 type:complete len:508 (+) Transcript_12212:63-1586(+)